MANFIPGQMVEVRGDYHDPILAGRKYVVQTYREATDDWQVSDHSEIRIFDVEDLQESPPLNLGDSVIVRWHGGKVYCSSTFEYVEASELSDDPTQLPAILVSREQNRICLVRMKDLDFRIYEFLLTLAYEVIDG